MPNPNLAVPEQGANDKQTIQNLFDTILKYRKELQYLLNHLDDSNMQKITAAVIDTSTLIVGDNIAMGPNAVLTWEQIDGAPNTTYIDANGIYTGEVTAEQITAGILTGFTIRTADIGSPRIQLNSAGINSYNRYNELHGIQFNPSSPYSEFEIFYDGESYPFFSVGKFTGIDGMWMETQGNRIFDSDGYATSFWTNVDMNGNLITGCNSFVKTNASAQDIMFQFFEGATTNYFEVYFDGYYVGKIDLA